jgi:Ca2+-transporting ATPase
MSPNALSNPSPTGGAAPPIQALPESDTERPGSATPWALPAPSLLDLLHSSATLGLTTEEAAARLERDGPNELPEADAPSPLRTLIAQFRSLVVWVLLGAGAVALALGEVADSIAIAAIVFLNAMIGFYQEYHAEQALAALRRMSAPAATVVRGGVRMSVPAAHVVRGDLLALESGDLVAADARLLEAAALRTNEAPLTGESEPVDKPSSSPLPESTSLGDRTNMVFFGTSVAAGQGLGLVVSTGMETELGKIAGLLHRTSEPPTPLQQRLDQVGRSLLGASLVIVALVFVLGLLRGEPLAPMLLTSLSLAIAAIPEGLPAVVTVALALGASRMARRNALLRRLAAVETLGCAEVICADKTGTLTVGQMTTARLYAGGKHYRLTGEGLDLAGAVENEDDRAPAETDPAVIGLLRVAAGCNDAAVRSEAGQTLAVGDPTEVALIVAAAKAGVLPEKIERDAPRRAVIPFDSSRRRMTVVRGGEDVHEAQVKGAPEAVLPLCIRWMNRQGLDEALTPEVRTSLAEVHDRYAREGLRVIAAAQKRWSPSPAAPTDTDALECDLTLVGFLALRDPPRPESRKAVEACREAGIRVVMITGDHPGTAGAIARDLGLINPADAVVTGAELAAMTQDEFRRHALQASVFARVTAEHKLRLVEAMRRDEIVVAMTGDGVNDAPALRHADIGVAMGRGGTEVTRQAADMVLTDDNFASIVAAVEEGRGVYDNIRKCLHFLLTGNAAEIMVMLAAIVAGWPIPFTPLQILWINLVTDGLPALALAGDPVGPDVLRKPPRRRSSAIADREFTGTVLVTALLIATASLAAFSFGLFVLRNVEIARTAAFSTVVYGQLFRALGSRSRRRAFWNLGTRSNKAVWLIVGGSVAVQLLIQGMTPLRAGFHLASMPAELVVATLGLGMSPFVMLEVYKALNQHVRRAPAPSAP